MIGAPISHYAVFFTPEIKIYIQTLNNQPPSGVVSLKVYLPNPHSNPQYTSPHYKFLSTSFPTIVLMPSPPRDCQENFVFRVFITLIWICKSRGFSWWYCCHQHLPHFIRHSLTKFINNLVPWVIKLVIVKIKH